MGHAPFVAGSGRRAAAGRYSVPVKWPGTRRERDPMFDRGPIPAALRSTVVVLTLAASGCVAVRYQRPGQPMTPRGEEALVFGRLRFFHDGREFFSWNVGLFPPPVATDTERHVWLLRLGRRAVSAEIHPDPYGSLAIWLASGDYTLVGSTDIPTSGPPAYEVIGLVRVPEGPVAVYAGELILKTETHEGWYAAPSRFGEASVAVLANDAPRAAFEQRFGALPEPPAVSRWCAGDHLPAFNDPELATRASELLDHGCEKPPAGGGAP